jgi:hypothetical protein
MKCPASSTFSRKKHRMNRTNSEAAVYVDSVETQEKPVEIDLYADWTAFERLTPDEQARLAVHPATTAAKEDSAIEDSAQSAECITDSGQASTSFVDTDTAEGRDIVEEQTLSDLNDDQLQLDGHTAENQPSSSSSHIGDDLGEAGTLISEQIQPEQPDYASTGQTLNGDENSEGKEAGSDVPVTPSGSLGGLESDVEFTGALSRGVCIACGAESSTDDLFCLACGVFIEDIS